MVDIDKGFSLWLDFIERDFLQNSFGKLIEKGAVNGATSNPAIFANAISNSAAYDDQLVELKGKSAKEKYESLAVRDIKNAAIALRGVYDAGSEGFISIEVDPYLAHNTQGTIEEARRLFKAIDEPNVMIKIPATEAGYSAMRSLLGDGICVNATLVFSPEQARMCLNYMKEGIEEFDNSGGERIEAVISVFVSRFDQMLDDRLDSLGLPVSKTGIMNAARIYNMIERNHTPSVRTLFASTGVKNESLPDDYYIRQLYAPHSVNTASLAALELLDQGEPPVATLPYDDKTIDEFFEKLEQNGIIFSEVCQQLMQEGLEAFRNSFSDMLTRLEEQ